MINTEKKYYHIETKINCFGEWNSMYSLSYQEDDEREFITYIAKKVSSIEIKNEDDFEGYLHDNWCDQDLFEDYCIWLEGKYPNYKFDLHVIPEKDDDVSFVIEANEIVRGKNERSMD